MTAVKEKIKTMLEAGGDFNNNDILVNLSTAAVLPFKIGSTYNTKERTLKNLLDVAKRFEKETGSYPLCVSKGSLLWNKGEKSLQTPILLIPCKAHINKINGEVSINLNEDDAFVNPYLLKRLKNEFELDIEGKLIWEDIVNFLKNNGLDQLNRESCFIGNFHHHRYDILRELEELVISIDFVLNVKIIAEAVQPETDKLLNKL
jgi:hypothetical protein